MRAQRGLQGPGPQGRGLQGPRGAHRSPRGPQGWHTVGTCCIVFVHLRNAQVGSSFSSSHTLGTCCIARLHLLLSVQLAHVSLSYSSSRKFGHLLRCLLFLRLALGITNHRLRLALPTGVVVGGLPSTSGPPASRTWPLRRGHQCRHLARGSAGLLSRLALAVNQSCVLP